MAIKFTLSLAEIIYFLLVIPCEKNFFSWEKNYLIFFSTVPGSPQFMTAKTAKICDSIKLAFLWL